MSSVFEKDRRWKQPLTQGSLTPDSQVIHAVGLRVSERDTPVGNMPSCFSQRPVTR
jgi:hypothetical protein